MGNSSSKVKLVLHCACPWKAAKLFANIQKRTTKCGLDQSILAQLLPAAQLSRYAVVLSVFSLYLTTACLEHNVHTRCFVSKVNRASIYSSIKPGKLTAIKATWPVNLHQTILNAYLVAANKELHSSVYIGRDKRYYPQNIQW